MTKPITDMSASVRARLMKNSKEQGKPFDEIMTLYMLERLLYRLSYSRYREQFVLKGGLLLCALFNDMHRTTKDVDLLARQLASQLDVMKSIFLEVCSTEYNDGLIFDSENLQTIRIKEDAEYEGVRVVVICHLGQAKKALQIDIGYGDVIVPKPQSMKYPAMLDMDEPEILAYSIESVVAEKFESMISLAQLNSRMKDFYDIYAISRQFDFDGRVLYEAVFATFQRRGTIYNKEAAVFTEEFKLLHDKHLQWKAYMKRSAMQELKFEDVLDEIKAFLWPVFQAILQEREFFGNWSAQKGTWENSL